MSAWILLGAAGVAGLVFSLYRNDVLLGMARSGGWEPRYLALEARLLGTPGWGTPRSLSVELQSATPESAAESAAQPAARHTAEPAAPPAAATNAPTAASVAAAAPTPGAVEPTSASPARATSDGVKIVSLDALAKLPVAQPAAEEAVRAATSPPAHRASEQAAPAAARATVERSAPAPVAKAPIAKAPAVARATVERSAPAPVAKAPIAKAPVPKAPAATPPPANDNPLKAAIRSAIVKESQAK